MQIINRGMGGDFPKSVILDIEKILPVMNTILAAWLAPFNEQELLCLRYIAWSLVGLESEFLDVLDFCFWADDMQETFVVGDEVGCIYII